MKERNQLLNRTTVGSIVWRPELSGKLQIHNTFYVENTDNVEIGIHVNTTTLLHERQMQATLKRDGICTVNQHDVSKYKLHGISNGTLPVLWVNRYSANANQICISNWQELPLVSRGIASVGMLRSLTNSIQTVNCNYIFFESGNFVVMYQRYVNGYHAPVENAFAVNLLHIIFRRTSEGVVSSIYLQTR
jgi:hypothetical protein